MLHYFSFVACVCYCVLSSDSRASPFCFLFLRRCHIRETRQRFFFFVSRVAPLLSLLSPLLIFLCVCALLERKKVLEERTADRTVRGEREKAVVLRYTSASMRHLLFAYLCLPFFLFLFMLPVMLSVAVRGLKRESHDYRMFSHRIIVGEKKVDQQTGKNKVVGSQGGRHTVPLAASHRSTNAEKKLYRTMTATPGRTCALLAVLHRDHIHVAYFLVLKVFSPLRRLLLCYLKSPSFFSSRFPLRTFFIFSAIATFVGFSLPFSSSHLIYLCTYIYSHTHKPTEGSIHREHLLTLLTSLLPLFFTNIHVFSFPFFHPSSSTRQCIYLLSFTFCLLSFGFLLFFFSFSVFPL